MEGVLSLGECITRFQWVEFLRQNLDKYMMILGNINSMKQAVSQKNKEQTTKFLGEFKMNSTELLADFKLFIATRSKSSETFRYWNNFTEMVCASCVTS